MINLTIYHKINLTRQERYDLHDGKKIITTGVSVPVWHIKKASSEPAKEIFCKYYIFNNKKNIPVKIVEDGYEIEIPHQSFEKKPLKKIPNFLKKFFPEAEKNLIIDEKEKKVRDICSKSLLDIKDGGSKSLNYREFNKVKSEGNMITVAHYLNIEDISHLENSLYNE